MIEEDDFDDVPLAQMTEVLEEFATKLGLPKDEAYAVFDAMCEPDKDFASMKLERLRKKVKMQGH